MSDLIPITTDSQGVQAVLGRDLHNCLEVKANYRDWFPRMVEYGFEAGTDYAHKIERVPGANGREYEQTNHVISLDMAKELAMIQRTEKGKQARRYFIEVEKRAMAPELSGRELMARALLEADSTIRELESRATTAEAHARELEAPAKSWNTMASAGGDYSVAEAAKSLSRDPRITIGRDQLFHFMHEQYWIFRTRGHRAHWEASQGKAINTGRLVHKLSRPFLNESTGEWEQGKPTVRVTPKGLHELHLLLGGSGQLELVEVTA